MRLRTATWGLGALALCALLACAVDDPGSLEGFGSTTPTHGGHDAGATSTDDAGSSTLPPPPSTSDDGGSVPLPPHPSTDASVPPADAGAPSHDASAPPPPGQDASTPPSNGFDQFQNHNLDVVNMYRATLGVAPLVLDKQLCDFALAGSQELSQDHMPHQHFINASNDGSLWTSGFSMGAAENQGDPNGWYMMSSDPTQNELLQIDDIQKAMFDEGPGSGEAHGHYTNMMNAAYKRLGVGLLEVSGKLYLTNDFSE